MLPTDTLGGSFQSPLEIPTSDGDGIIIPPTFIPVPTETPPGISTSPIETPTPGVTDTSTPTLTPTLEVTPTPIPGDTIPIGTVPMGEAILYMANQPVDESSWHSTIQIAPLNRLTGEIGPPSPLSLPIKIRESLFSIASVSPNGRYIIFTANVYHQPDGRLFIWDRDTNRVKLLNEEHPNAIVVDWSADSSRILVTTLDDSLYLLNVETGAETILPNIYGVGHRAALSPDGQQVVFVYGQIPNELWIVDSNGENRHRFLGLDYGTQVLGWSIRGILYMDSIPGLKPRGPLALANLLTGEREIFDANTGFGYGSALSPDRSQFAFTGVKPNKGIGGCVDDEGQDLCKYQWAGIYIFDTNNKEVTYLTEGLAPAWTPDGAQLLFLSTQSGSSEVWLINADGSEPRQLTNDGLNKSQAFWLKGKGQ
ncbi:MAG: hypothetical protein U0401_01315 [Anaerolineae bacterium]